MALTGEQSKQLRRMGFPESLIRNVENERIVSPVDFRLDYRVGGQFFPGDPNAKLVHLRNDPVQEFVDEEVLSAQETGPMNGEDIPIAIPQFVGGGAPPVDTDFVWLPGAQEAVNALGPEEAGVDLRDTTAIVEFEPTEVALGGALAISAAALVARLGAGVGRTALMGLFRGFARGSRVAWNRLPAWARSALTIGGVVVGTEIIMDIPLVPGEGAFGDGGGLTTFSPGVSIVGGWTANGVQFYRLSDGKLAVQNKHGRWKVWRPKKPIVLMPTGAGNLRTLLRADAVLNRQSKKIAAMLNRRARKSPSRPRKESVGQVVIGQDGSRITQI